MNDHETTWAVVREVFGWIGCFLALAIALRLLRWPWRVLCLLVAVIRDEIEAGRKERYERGEK